MTRRTSARRRVPAAPERISPLLEAVERHREWYERVIRGRSLTDPGTVVVGIGRRDQLHQHLRGLEFEVTLVVSEHEPPRRIAWRSEAWRVAGKPQALNLPEVRQSFTLEPAGDDTEVTVAIEYEPRKAWERLVSRLGRRFERRQLERALERLARIAASGDPEGAHSPGPALRDAADDRAGALASSLRRVRRRRRPGRGDGAVVNRPWRPSPRLAAEVPAMRRPQNAR